MEEYFELYDSFDRKVVYDFGLGYGGIGDLIKFFMNLFNICVKHKIQIYYLVHNTPVEKYLKLKYPKMYVTQDEISNHSGNLHNIDSIPHIQNDKYYLVKPHLFHYRDTPFLSPLHMFYFSEDVISNAYLNIYQPHFQMEYIPGKEYDGPKYISIHLRLGDKFLETDRNFIQVKEDTRYYVESNIFNFIESNSDKTILFFCDNNSYKQKIKNKYSNIIITNYEIGHTSFLNTTEIQVLNTLTDFYLISNSEHIIAASYSGFAEVASTLHNVPMTKLYK
jgi:hypothetical protein